MPAGNSMAGSITWVAAITRQRKIRKGFTELGVQRVVAETMAVHIASRRVMEKAGPALARSFHQPWPYVIEGDEQGDVEYALSKTDWEQQEATGHGGTAQTGTR
jgi:hypothetical protein